MSWCLVRLSNGGLGPPCEIVSLPARTQRRNRRGAAFANGLDPLAFRGDERGRCKALFCVVVNGTIGLRSRPCLFFTQPESTANDIIFPRISFAARATVVPVLDWLPACVADDFCNPEDHHALGDDSSFFAVTQQQWRACVRRMVRCTLACVLPPSFLDPTVASGAFAVAKDENRDRFIGDRRPFEQP